MKKKYSVTNRDKKDWVNFIKDLSPVYDKDNHFTKKSISLNKMRKLDLHGFSLSEANKMVEKFIIESFKEGYRKLLIVTGKGSRSKISEDPYRSEKMNVLKYSVPEYIINNENLSKKITKISKSSLEDGGEGAIYIFLKNIVKFKE